MNIEEEAIDKIVTNEIDWLRNGLKVLIMAYWKKSNFEKRYGIQITGTEWEKFLEYMKPKGHQLNNIIYNLSDEYFSNNANKKYIQIF